MFDPAREALVLEKNTARVQNPELQPYYREFLKKALAVSRAYQHVQMCIRDRGYLRYFVFLQMWLPSDNWMLWNNRNVLWTMKMCIRDRW